jgi:hypothetical protein
MLIPFSPVHFSSCHLERSPILNEPIPAIENAVVSTSPSLTAWVFGGWPESADRSAHRS